MNSEPAIQSPDIGEPDGPEGQNRSGGCSKLIVLMTLCAVMFVVLVYLIIDLMNGWGKAANLVREIRKPEVVEKIVEKEKIVEVEKEKIVEVEKKAPLPETFVSRKTIDTVELWNGLQVQSSVETVEGGRAATERSTGGSFGIELKVNLKIPKANQSIKELAELNGHLPKILPGLEQLVETAKVSPFYHQLYELKAKRFQEQLTRLDRLVSRHNFFDCETILELTHPETGKRALLLQGEMDVVSDGSDGDRWPELDDYISMSENYQYSTSYSWPKKTKTPNPLLANREAELKKKEARFAVKGLSIEENRQLREAISRLKAQVGDLKYRSFLIAEADPFVVIPLSMLGRRGETPFGPAIGDYAAVIYGEKIYPAICGDAGPGWKTGEASLRMAKELNPKAGVYNRPVSDLEVTYLIFPGSADETRDAPDLEHWEVRCLDLLNGIGGLGEGYELHEWEDLIAKKKGINAPAPDSAPALPEPGDGPAGVEPGKPKTIRPLPPQPETADGGGEN